MGFQKPVETPRPPDTPRNFIGMPKPPAPVIPPDENVSVSIELADACDVLNVLTSQIHKINRRWWKDLQTGEPILRNKGELLMLIVSEVAEAMEGERKDVMDTHLTHRKMAEVELADVLIRVFDYAGGFGYDLAGAVREKLVYNTQRADHKKEARQAADGKKW